MQLVEVTTRWREGSSQTHSLCLISVLGEVVATGRDGPVLAVLGAELPPFEALMNSSSWVGRISAAAGLREGEGDSALGGLAIAGRPCERRIRI